jgi:hypothetical protein
MALVERYSDELIARTVAAGWPAGAAPFTDRSGTPRPGGPGAPPADRNGKAGPPTGTDLSSIPPTGGNGNGTNGNGAKRPSGPAGRRSGKAKTARNGATPPNSDAPALPPADPGLAALEARLCALEERYERLADLHGKQRDRMAPMAQALGCCGACLVGMEECPTCGGKGGVGYRPPDLELLAALIVRPFEAHGVHLALTPVVSS